MHEQSRTSHTSLVWMSYVTFLDELCHLFQWVMSLVWMSHVTRLDELCHLLQWIMGWLRLVGIDKITGLFCKRALLKRRYSAKETYNLIDPTNQSHPICHLFGWVMSLVSMSYVTFLTESCRVISRKWKSCVYTLHFTYVKIVCVHITL